MNPSFNIGDYILFESRHPSRNLHESFHVEKLSGQITGIFTTEGYDTKRYKVMMPNSKLAIVGEHNNITILTEPEYFLHLLER